MQGRSSEQEQLVKQIEADPDNPRHHFLLGLSYSESGQWSLAVDAFRRVIDLAPQVDAAYFNLGNACFELHQFSQAVDAYTQAMRLCPEWDTARNIGKALAANGQWEQAIHQFQQLLQSPDLSAEQRGANLRDLGFATVQSGDWQSALQFFEHSHAESPSDQSWECLLIALQAVVSGTDLLRRADGHSIAQATTRMVIEAARALQRLSQHRKALERLVDNTQAPTDPSILFESLAEVHFRQGHLSEALGCMHNLNSQHPGTTSWLSSWVDLLSYGSQVTPKRIFENARRWYEAVQEQRPKDLLTPEFQQKAPPTSGKIGILVNELSRWVVELQILPWLRHRPQDSMHITLLWDHWGDCSWTDELRELVDQWRPIAMWTDVGLANWLRQQQISVLIDTVGHGLGSRLSLPTRFPNYTHAVWNYRFQTSGSDDVDYVVYDRVTANWIDPQYVCERVISPSGPVWCFDTQPAVVPAHRRPGPIRFGFAGPLCLIIPETIDLWTMVLEALPESQLIARTEEWECEHLRGEFLESFARRGVDSNRIRCESSQGKLTSAERLEDVDIYLDTAPCNCLTGLMDALAMGRPIVSLSGQRPTELISRGLREYCASCISCAQSPQQFVESASAMALQVTHAHKESVMRQAEFLQSPLCKPIDYAQSIDALLISLLQPAEKT